MTGYEIGNAIRQERKARHMTLKEFADVADVSFLTLERIERFDRAARIDTYFKILEAMGMELEVVRK